MKSRRFSVIAAAVLAATAVVVIVTAAARNPKQSNPKNVPTGGQEQVADGSEPKVKQVALSEADANPTQRALQVIHVNAPTEDTAGEDIPEAIPGAESIPMLDGPNLVVIPADANKSRADQNEWRFIPIFRIVSAKYDSKNRLLACRIDARLSTETRDRVYARLREITSAPLQTAFHLNPVRLQTLTVELSALNKRIQLYSEKSGHDIIAGTIPWLYRVEKGDDDLHKLCAENLRDLSITVRSTHPYAAFKRNSIQVASSLSVAREAIEKVLPKGMAAEELEKHPLIVDQASLLQLKQVLREEVGVHMEGDQAKLASLDKVLEKMLARISVSKVPLHQVSQEVVDSVLVYDSKTARLAVSPSERTTITNALVEANEKRAAYKHAWDTMKEEARKTNDERAWHKTLLNKMALDAKLKLGIGIYSGSASLNLQKEHNSSDKGAVKALRETFERMKNAGEMSQETFEKSYRDFKGKDYARSVAGKILCLERVSNLNLHSFRSALLEHIERHRKGIRERVTVLPLEPSSTQQADALQKIELLKREIATMKILAEGKFSKLDTKLTTSNNAWIERTSVLADFTNQLKRSTDSLAKRSAEHEKYIKTLKALTDVGLAKAWAYFDASGIRAGYNINRVEGAGHHRHRFHFRISPGSNYAVLVSAGSDQLSATAVLENRSDSFVIRGCPADRGLFVLVLSKGPLNP